jgi:hypothetical protein
MGLLSHWCGFMSPCLLFALYLGVRHNRFALLLPLALSFPDKRGNERSIAGESVKIDGTLGGSVMGRFWVIPSVFLL